MSDMDADRFRQWLRRHTQLSEQSIGDVISRTRRVQRYVSIDAAASDVHVLRQLEDHSEFHDLSPTVQSQLKRAAHLYRRFRQLPKRA